MFNSVNLDANVFKVFMMFLFLFVCFWFNGYLGALAITAHVILKIPTIPKIGNKIVILFVFNYSTNIQHIYSLFAYYLNNK